MQELKPIKEGKVREIYDNGDSLIMVATDRISCFDVILHNEVKMCIRDRPYLFYVKRHTPRQICHRFLVGPFLQDLTDSQKEHHGRCSLHIATEHRYTDGCSIQYRNFQLAEMCIRDRLLFGSGPPSLTATAISRPIMVKTLPFAASFRCV